MSHSSWLWTWVPSGVLKLHPDAWQRTHEGQLHGHSLPKCSHTPPSAVPFWRLEELVSQIYRLVASLIHLLPFQASISQFLSQLRSNSYDKSSRLAAAVCLTALWLMQLSFILVSDCCSIYPTACNFLGTRTPWLLLTVPEPQNSSSQEILTKRDIVRSAP